MEAEPEKTEKVLVIMRGLPGSGKSTKAKKIAGEAGLIFSTDDFFMVNGQYVYDVKKIGEYHDKNFQRTVEAMEQGKPLIVVDNTNTKLWEMKHYVVAADERGYSVRIEESDTPWAFNFKQCAKRNTHNVPEDTCKRMRDNYETFEHIDQIRNAKSFRDKKKF